MKYQPFNNFSSRQKPYKIYGKFKTSKTNDRSKYLFCTYVLVDALHLNINRGLCRLLIGASASLPEFQLYVCCE